MIGEEAGQESVEELKEIVLDSDMVPSRSDWISGEDIVGIYNCWNGRRHWNWSCTGAGQNFQGYGDFNGRSSHSSVHIRGQKTSSAST